MDSSFFLEIDVGEYHPVTHRMAFETRADAVMQLNLLEPRLGHGKFRNDPATNRHRIQGPDGDLVVVLEHVRSVRVIDRAAYDELAAYAYEREAASSGNLAALIGEVAATTMHALQKADQAGVK